MVDEVQKTIMLRVLVAAVAGVVVGFDRERSGKAAGIRTQMLVCVGSALLASVSVYLGEMYRQAMADPARLMAQIVSGIGFLGAGVILKNGGNKVVGVTTAATIWITAAIGIAIGAGFYLPAVLTTVLVLLLNPLAVYQYRFGLKGDDYVLEMVGSGGVKVKHLLEKLGVKVRKEKINGRSAHFWLLSSEQKNQEILIELNNRRVKARIEREEGE